jgi:hypothetical protein
LPPRNVARSDVVGFIVLRVIHAAGRAAFLRVDALFNRVFGEALNPLYYLGAISYFMFWVVIVSGFYVYAFYETGVELCHSTRSTLAVRC